MATVIHFVVFGFILSTAVGMLISWIDRRVTACVQYRVGPPLFQPVFDLVKLSGKELLMPRGVSKIVFLGAPIVGLAGIMLVSTLLCLVNIWPSRTFFGDLIVVVYLLVLPSLGIIVGGFASRNPLASIGASREMKLMLAYELPFVIALFVPIIKSGPAITLGAVINGQLVGGAILSSLSGVLSFFVILWCVQAKLGLVPFDVAEAETELAGGALIEYSGPALALFKLTKIMMFFSLPFFMTIVYVGGIHINSFFGLKGLLTFVLIVVLAVVIRNTNPRLRIDQIVKFFWGLITPIAIAAVFLAGRGL